MVYYLGIELHSFFKYGIVSLMIQVICVEMLTMIGIFFFSFLSSYPNLMIYIECGFDGLTRVGLPLIAQITFL